MALGTRVTSLTLKVRKLTPDLSETITIKYERGEVDRTIDKTKSLRHDWQIRLNIFSIWNEKLGQNQGVNVCNIRLGVKAWAGPFACPVQLSDIGE